MGSLSPSPAGPTREVGLPAGEAVSPAGPGSTDPPGLLSEGGGGGAVGAAQDFVAEGDVGNQEGDEIDCREELLIGAEPGVEESSLVVNHAVLLAVGEPAERNGCALHVGEEAFESFSVVGLDLPLEIHGEAIVLPRPHALDGLGPHLLAAEHHAEERFAEDLLEAGEVDILHGEEGAVGSEESEGNHRVKVWVVHDEVAEALRRGDHTGTAWSTLRNVPLAWRRRKSRVGE